MNNRKMEPIHPGEILYKDFMEPMGITQYRLAKEIKVGAIRISEIIRKKRSITADTALRLAKFFNMSPKFWMNAQSSYDLDAAMMKQKNKDQI